MLRSRAALPALVIACSLVAAACGSDDDSSSSDTVTDSASESADGAEASDSASASASEPASSSASASSSEPVDDDVADDAVDEGAAGEDSDGADGVTYPRTLEHSLGTTVLEEPPVLILPLFGELLGEKLLALGIEPVGALPYMSALPATSDTYGLEALYDVEPIGSGFEPNLEAIAALRPDLIISDDTFFASLYEPLSEIAPTFTLDLFSDDWKSDFLVIADVVGETERAEEVIAEYDARVAELAPEVEARFGGQTVALVQQSLPDGGTGDGGVDGARIYGADTNPGRFLADLGIEVWDPEDPGGSEIAPSTYAVSFEIIPTIDADAIIYLIEDSFMATREVVEDDPLWNATPAAAAGDFVFLDFGAQVRLGGPLHKFVALDAVEALLAGQETGGVADAPEIEVPDTGDGGTTVVDVGAEGGATLIAQFTPFSPGFAEAAASDGPVTVFLPGDEALGAMQTDLPDLAAALQADFELLDEVLQYHVVADGAFGAADLAGVTEIPTLQGEPITVEVVDGQVVLNGGQATVVAADLVADNGVSHVIDGLLIPPSRAAELGL
ncbi:MAG: ABC transporter substrate-binding protein [Actinomycetota bacterium]